MHKQIAHPNSAQKNMSKTLTIELQTSYLNLNLTFSFIQTRIWIVPTRKIRVPGKKALQLFFAFH